MFLLFKIFSVCKLKRDSVTVIEAATRITYCYIKDCFTDKHDLTSNAVLCVIIADLCWSMAELLWQHSHEIIRIVCNYYFCLCIGTDKDAENLMKLFIKLGFYTNRYDNLTGKW